MKLHIDSEVNPWPFGHLELNQIIIKPLEYQTFVYNQTKYQLFEGHLGELFSIVITFYDYDHPTWKINSTNERFPTIKTENYFNDKYHASTDIGVVSNIVKKELVKNAILSLVIALIGVIIYVSFRFKWSYAISGIIALLHDVFLVLTLFSLLKLEVSTIFVAAILSIIGYSINNTIVVFDRIRENLHKKEIKNVSELEKYVLIRRAKEAL